MQNKLRHFFNYNHSPFFVASGVLVLALTLLFILLDTYDFVLSAAFVTSFALMFGAWFWFKRTLGKDNSRYVIRLYIVYILVYTVYITSPDGFRFGSPIGAIIFAPISIMLSILPLLIGLKFALHQKDSATGAPGIENTELVDAYLKKLLESDRLSVALTSALPVGDKDRKYGLDFIPFMLREIEQRRQRFQRSSRLFLITTILLGLAFIILVSAFGFIILNEDSVGAPRVARNLMNEIQTASEIVASFPLEKLQKLTADTGEIAIQELRHLLPDSERYEIAGHVQAAVDLFQSDKDYNTLRRSLDDAIRQFAEPDAQERAYVARLMATKEIVEELLRRQKLLADFSRGVRELGASASSVEGLAERFSERLSTREERVTELVKRLAIGIVVCTFFIVILKYTSGIYRSHHQHMIAAENQDSAIRAFYVAFKGAGDDVKLKREAISSLLARQSSGPAGEKDTTDSKPELEFVKEILEGLVKKL